MKTQGPVNWQPAAQRYLETAPPCLLWGPRRLWPSQRKACCLQEAVRSGSVKQCFPRLTVQTPVVVFLICSDGIVLPHKDHLCYPRMDQPSPLQGSAHTEKLLQRTRGIRAGGEFQTLILPACRSHTAERSGLTGGFTLADMPSTQAFREAQF